MGYVLTHTLSGSCNGSIVTAQVSASTSTTPPYLVSWSGTNSGYTATTFDITNLCADDYVATLTDVTGATATTSITISAFTVPSISARLSNDDCILDPNKRGEITIDSSTTTTPSYLYELRKNNKLLDTYYGTTANTTHTFSDIENGMYSITVMEEKILTYTEEPAPSGCTPYNYNDNATAYGWNLVTVIGNTWENYIPNAPFHLPFSSTWGPATGGTKIYYEAGMLQDGTIDSANPYVWFYTGTTSSRMTDTGQDWYVGVSALTKEEGNNWVGPDIARTTANIGKFYYNSFINKFEYLWYSYAGVISWVTYDPRVNYGKPGNPRASNLTGGTSGTTLMDLSPIDVTINASNVVVAASSIYPDGGTLGKLYSHSNNSQITGMLSKCLYNNYSWQTSFNATDDDDSIYIILASFRDDDAKYGPSGVTHSLYIQFNGTTGNITIGTEADSSAYGLGQDNNSPFRNCQHGSGCTTVNPYYAKSTLATFDDYLTPFSAGTTWLPRGSVRMKVNRSGTTGENFHIQFTETMGTGASATILIGDDNAYNAKYDINFNLLDKTTWSGNSFSAYDSYSWLDKYSLCKYLGSRKIGYAQKSQAQTSWYHIQFTGSPSQQNIIAPLCDNTDGPSTTVQITATTGTTTNIIETNDRTSHTSTERGVPKIRPRVNVSLQTMPLPTLDVVGLSRSNLKLSKQIGNIPELSVYNTSEGTGTYAKFYFGGDNTDMLFENMYAKFRIYPYVSELEEVATSPVYEAIFDTLPTYYDISSQSNILSASTFIPWSGICTGKTWEYIIRPSYLFKDKNSPNDVWTDTATYPSSKTISNTQDFYMALLNNPPIPNLILNSFRIPFTPPQMKIEGVKVKDMPEPGTPAFSTATYTHVIRSANASKPLVMVNGVVVAEGFSGKSSTVFASGRTDPPNVNTILATGDYKHTFANRGVTFFAETVQNGDQLQFMYDAAGGSWTQFFTMPATVSTVNTEMIFEENGYYYINLDKQAFGGVSLAINGLHQGEGLEGFQKVDDSRIQLTQSLDTYKEGDVFSLFYKTIYMLAGFTTNKEPQIPVNYIKDKPLLDTIKVKLFNNDGDLVQELVNIIAADTLGGVYRSFTLIPPTPGNYKYKVSITRQYPLVNGESVYATSQTDLISFEITRDVFYSPSGIALVNDGGPGGASISSTD